MPLRILSNDLDRLPLPVANPSTTFVIAALWLVFACGLPLHQLREARQQARQDLARLLAADRSDAGKVLEAFDRSNQDLDAAAFGPCLVLAVTSILLVNQLLRLKRRYDALAHLLSTTDHRPVLPR